jgi:RHS repeat-associated protein
VEETAFYPFGLARHEHRLHSEEDPYQFSQKERDAESGLNYFEARFLAARLARFVTMDPKYSHPDQLSGGELASFLANPQALNPYAYVFNNPLCYRDPSGLDPNSENDTKKHLETINKGSDFLGALAGGAELFAKEGGTLWGVTKAGGAATGFIGVAFKGVELINDPNADTASAFSWEVSKGAIGTLNPIAGVAIYVGELFGLDIGKGLNWVGHKIGTSLAEGPNLIEMVEEHRQDVHFRQRTQKAAEL